jgi:hypothetical protein
VPADQQRREEKSGETGEDATGDLTEALLAEEKARELVVVGGAKLDALNDARCEVVAPYLDGTWSTSPRKWR